MKNGLRCIQCRRFRFYITPSAIGILVLLLFLPIISQASSNSYSSYIAKVKSVCDGKTLPVTDLFTTSPYDIKGKCYSLPLTTVSQLISRHSELIAGFIMLVFSGSGHDVYPMVYPSVVVGLGPFRYTTVAGALRVVPMVRYVARR